MCAVIELTSYTLETERGRGAQSELVLSRFQQMSVELTFRLFAVNFLANTAKLWIHLETFKSAVTP